MKNPIPYLLIIMAFFGGMALESRPDKATARLHLTCFQSGKTCLCCDTISNPNDRCNMLPLIVAPCKAARDWGFRVVRKKP